MDLRHTEEAYVIRWHQILCSCKKQEKHIEVLLSRLLYCSSPIDGILPNSSMVTSPQSIYCGGELLYYGGAVFTLFLLRKLSELSCLLNPLECCLSCLGIQTTCRQRYAVRIRPSDSPQDSRVVNIISLLSFPFPLPA